MKYFDIVEYAITKIYIKLYFTNNINRIFDKVCKNSCALEFFFLITHFLSISSVFLRVPSCYLMSFTLSHFLFFLFSARTSNRVFTTVIGINRAPDMDRAVMPKEMACRAVRGSSRLKACFSQCSDEKYKPTPGITLVIDCKLTFIMSLHQCNSVFKPC